MFSSITVEYNDRVYDSEEPLYDYYAKKNNIPKAYVSVSLLQSCSKEELLSCGRYACTLSLLPNEMLFEILSYLRYDGAILALGRTSRFFSSIVSEFTRYRICYRMNTILHPHQMDAIRRMKLIESMYTSNPAQTNSINGLILKHEMGLGKTLTAISHSITSPKGEYPTLIVCSKTALIEWQCELQKHFGLISSKKSKRSSKKSPSVESPSVSLPVLVYHKHYISKEKYTNMTRDRLKRYELVLTTYDVLVTECTENRWSERAIVRTASDRVDSYVRVMGGYESDEHKGPACLFHTLFERMITDESHAFNNPKSKTFAAVMSVMARFSYCLSGTPMRNSYTDLWSLFKFMGLAPYTKKYGFNVNYRHTDFSDIMYKQYDLSRYVHSLTYKDANIVLPPRVDREIVIQFSPMEKYAYEYFENGAKNAFRGYLAGNMRFDSILTMFLRLRQCSIAPYLVCDISKRNFKKTLEDEEEEMLMRGLDRITNGLATWIKNGEGEAGIGSTKIRAILNVLRKIPSGEKCIVFSSFVSCLDLINDAIEKDKGLKGLGVCRLDGTVKMKDRKNDINEFKTLPNRRVLLSTYKCGSEGLNLTCACHVVCVEPWWTDTVEHQAVARCLRFGQTKPVTVYRINIKDSIETRMIKLIVEKKKEMRDKIYTSKTSTEKFTLEAKPPKKMTDYELGIVLGVYR